MKKVLALLMSCSLLLIGCKADDFNNETFQDRTTETLHGKTIILNQ